MQVRCKRKSSFDTLCMEVGMCVVCADILKNVCVVCPDSLKNVCAVCAHSLKNVCSVCQDSLKNLCVCVKIVSRMFMLCVYACVRADSLKIELKSRKWECFFETGNSFTLS
jgi:hypothetical protein